MRPLNVLFLSSDELVSQVRLLPLLEVLRRSGRITYATVDRDMRSDGSSGPFDVCLAHRSPGKRQMAWLRQHGVPLLYDIDDLLLKPHQPGDERADPVRWCLDHARIVTAASARLLATLECSAAGNMTGRIVLLPNAGRESAPPSKIESRGLGLIWMSSAQSKAASELPQICDGIAAAAGELNANITLVGRFSPSVLQRLPNSNLIPWIEPGSLFDWLAMQSSIAVAPLSTDLPEADQRFADCKSDIKIAQYGSSGIVGLYSHAAPYIESDLPRRIVARNDAASWHADILDAAASYPQEGDGLALHDAFATRRPSILAEKFFQQLQDAAAGGKPFAFRAIPTPRLARVVDRQIRRWLR